MKIAWRLIEEFTNITDRHTHRQTHRVTTEGTLSGFQDFFLQSIIKDRPNRAYHFELFTYIMYICQYFSLLCLNADVCRATTDKQTNTQLHKQAYILSKNTGNHQLMSKTSTWVEKLWLSFEEITVYNSLAVQLMYCFFYLFQIFWWWCFAS